MPQKPLFGEHFQHKPMESAFSHISESRDRLLNFGTSSISLASMLPINLSIIQGSGIGPTLFIMFAYDLRRLDILNFLIK